jgi:hypothetical protein
MDADVPNRPRVPVGSLRNRWEKRKRPGEMPGRYCYARVSRAYAQPLVFPQFMHL